MTVPDGERPWTHLTGAQAAGVACVMCAEPTVTPGWSGQVVGIGPRKVPVVACDGPCAEMATVTPPDAPEM